MQMKSLTESSSLSKKEESEQKLQDKIDLLEQFKRTQTNDRKLPSQDKF